MPKSKVTSSGRTTVLVEAHAETLFVPGAPVDRWMRVFADRLVKFTRGFAPGHKATYWRWSHYGTPLRETFSSAVSPNPMGLETGIAVGSSADHALYVDQGTGIYAGRTPYLARILPPWSPGSPSLYESTWRPGGKGRVREVWIKGQKGQFFFQRGLDRTFQSMLMRHYQIPTDPRMYSPAEAAAARKLSDFRGGTNLGPTFRSNLAQWREWRDTRWGLSDGRGGTGLLGKNTARNATRPATPRVKPSRPRKTDAQRRATDAARAKRYRDRLKARGEKPKRGGKNRSVPVRAREAMNDYMRAWAAKNPGWRIRSMDRNGFWVSRQGGGPQRRVDWTIRIIDLLYGRN